MIYADNAATTKLKDCALQAMQECHNAFWGNASGSYSLGQAARRKLEACRETVAALIGASEPDEIIFTSGGTESDNTALRFGAGEHIISNATEHHAVLRTLDALERDGTGVTLVPVDKRGILDLSVLERSFWADTRLVSVMSVNNETGAVQPIREIGEICRKHGVAFHTDAVQGIGHLDINVQRDKIDMLSLSAHKFGGPKGVGALYVRSGVKLPPYLYGGGQEYGLRSGTQNVAGIAGMTAALEDSVRNREENEAKLSMLSSALVAGLSDIDGAHLNGDRTAAVPGIVSFCFEGIEGAVLVLMLDKLGVCASSGSACTTGDLAASHVLLSMGVPEQLAYGALRLSLSPDLTLAKIDAVTKAVADSVAMLRRLK